MFTFNDSTKKYYSLWETMAMFLPANPSGDSQIISGACYAFAGTADFSEIVDSSDSLTVKVKVGLADPQAKEVDLSGAANIAAVTPAEFAAAVQTAGFTGLTASVETAGDNAGRVKLRASTPWVPSTSTDVEKYLMPWRFLVQVWFEGAEEAGFMSEYGQYLYPDMNGDCKGLVGTENFDEATTIEDDNGLGRKVTFTFAGKRGDETIEYTTQFGSDVMRQMFNGGLLLDNGLLLPSDNKDRKVDVFAFKVLTEKRSNVGNTGDGYAEYIHLGTTGHYSETEAAGSVTNGALSLTAGSVNNPNLPGDDKTMYNPSKRTYSNADWDAAKIQHLAVENWDAVAVA